MQLSPDVQTALNEQINAELWASYFYLSLANWADAQGFEGLRQWADVASVEERDHAQMFVDYVRDRGRVVCAPIEASGADYPDYGAALVAALNAEIAVTTHLQHVAELARTAGDAATANLCEGWIRTEQIPAIKELQDRLLVIARGAPIDLLDRELFGAGDD